MNVNDVKSLNKKIEELNKKKAKADMQREILTNKLTAELEKYRKTYGVNLVGSNFGDTKKLIKAEGERVSASIQEEYDLKVKVIKAIESGNIDEANKLLGIEKPVTVGVAGEEPKSTEVIDASDAFSDDAFADEDFDEESSNDDDFGIYDGDEVKVNSHEGITFDGNISANDAEEVIPEISTEDEDFDDFELTDDESDAIDYSDEGEYIDEDDKDDDFVMNPQNVKAKSINVDDIDFDFNGISVDDDDEDDDDFGFGEALKGTKFGI